MNAATLNGQVVVEILDGEVKDRQGKFTNDAGESISYHTRKQDARLESGGFAYPYDVRLEDGQGAFRPGRYTLRLDKMLKVNNGSVSLSKYAVLEPVKA